jgi:hypothetical protein
LRVKAEVQAFECCISEWLNRNPSFSLAGRCAWCGRPESPSAVVLPFGTEPGMHAWLHADCWAAWHQSRRQEAALALRKMGIAPVSSSGVTLIETASRRSLSRERMRRHRRRSRAGQQCVTVMLEEYQVWGLVACGFLAKDQRQNREAVAYALRAYLTEWAVPPLE